MSTTFVPAEKLRLSREEINRKQKEYIFPSVTTYYSDPLPMDHALMQHVWDADGNQYLDFFGGIVTVSVGHCNDQVNAKVQRADRHAAARLHRAFANEPQVALAKKIASDHADGELTKTFFTNSGTEANETAILAARMLHRATRSSRCATPITAARRYGDDAHRHGCLALGPSQAGHRARA